MKPWKQGHKGSWYSRFTREHRLVYRVSDKKRNWPKMHNYSVQMSLWRLIKPVANMVTIGQPLTFIKKRTNLSRFEQLCFLGLWSWSRYKTQSFPCRPKCRQGRLGVKLMECYPERQWRIPCIDKIQQFTEPFYFWCVKFHFHPISWPILYAVKSDE